MDRYLDIAGSAPLLPAAREAMTAALDMLGDPLTIHRPGRSAREALERARATVAAAIGAQPDEIVFTSGGTESVALAITGGAGARRGWRPTRSSRARSSTRRVGGAPGDWPTDGFEVDTIGTDRRDGRVDLDRFATAMRRPGTVLASIQHANHETGTLQQIGEAARLARAAGVVFHTDAAQTVGHLPIDVDALGVDLLSRVRAQVRRTGRRRRAVRAPRHRTRRDVSGATIVSGSGAPGCRTSPASSGWPPASPPSLAGLADEAARAWAMTARMRDRLAATVPGAVLHGHPTHRVPHLVCFSVSGLDPATLAMALDDRGFHIGAGSMASGRPDDPSHVLEQLGVLATPSFRVGVAPSTSDEDLEAFTATLPEVVAELQQVHRAAIATMARFQPPENGDG